MQCLALAIWNPINNPYCPRVQGLDFGLENLLQSQEHTGLKAIPAQPCEGIHKADLIRARGTAGLSVMQGTTNAIFGRASKSFRRYSSTSAS